MSAGARIVLLLGCLAAYAFFAGMETGIVAIRRLRLWHLVRRGSRGARLILRLLDQPDRFLGTTLVGTNLCSVTASVIAAGLASQWAGPWARPAAGALLTATVLIFCEFLPKNWFRARPVRTVPWAFLLYATGWVLAPLGYLAAGAARILTPRGLRSSGRKQPLLTRSDLLYLTRESEQAGALSTHERRMIDGVLTLHLKSAADLMTPLERMTVVRPQTPVESLLAIARDTGFSRLPVQDSESGRFIGVVFVPDAAAGTSAAAGTAGDFMRPPQFVPADIPADALLPRMRLTRQPMVLVEDHASQTVGLVTVEDVLRLIVGEP